jgi:hypothetical protein
MIRNAWRVASREERVALATVLLSAIAMTIMGVLYLLGIMTYPAPVLIFGGATIAASAIGVLTYGRRKSQKD